jgi:hypothetical protein
MAGRDGDKSKEGVDFKWISMKDSKGNIVKDGKGNAVKTRHFFTKAEKEAMKSSAPKKSVRPKTKPTAPKTSPRPKARPIEMKPLAGTGGPRRSANTGAAKKQVAGTGGGTRKKAGPKPATDYTYSQWRDMSRAERKSAGLPVSEIGGQLEFKRFMTGITGNEYTSKGKLEELRSRRKGVSATRRKSGNRK